MFRSSRAPFNGSSAFEAARNRPTSLLSPPETEPEPMAAPSLPTNETYASPDTPQGPVETPASRFRRVTYNTGGLLNRDSRVSQRQSKWLVTVVPPASLTHEPPVLGHTLSSGPAGRFSNGILMPLFPTLYGQLTALAREFNMPSTTGLCVYIHLQESGVSMMTPRISDETWQILWGHYFSTDDRAISYPSHGLPISGKIEFDIDLRRAKWFNAWMGIGPRERAESEYVSREPSIVHSHWRGDSRTSLFPTEQGGEESPSPPEATPTANIPFPRNISQRQVPRPLFLERRDASTLRTLPRHPSRGQNLSSEIQSNPAPPITAESVFVPNTLSPLVQELEEPHTVEKADLDSIVRQWRASSVTGGSTSAAVAAGQPSLDPINMPPGADIELDLDDFAWSISSAGPPLESPLSLICPSPLPSIHIAERAVGSVCLTPTTCTSWGPPSCPSSPVSYVSRQPSLDLGHRMMEHVPLTPSTATTWGPEDLPSPTFSLHRVPSVDLGKRNMGSAPATPSTITTWGPPDSPIIIPASPPYIRTPDAGERAFFDLLPEQRRAEQQTTISALGFPYYDAWTTEPWRHVWPYQAHRPLENQRDLITHSTSSGEFPCDHDETIPRIIQTFTSSLAQTFIDVKLTPAYPALVIYSAVYPYNLTSIYPSTSLVHKNLKAVRACLKNSVSANYPFFDIYPAVYPYNLDHIYPGRVPALPKLSSKEHWLLPEYPDFASLYPTDPSLKRARLTKAQRAIPNGTVYDYPYLVVYPPIYPFNVQAEEIYPRKVKSIYGHLEGGDEKSLAGRVNRLLSVAFPKPGYPNLTIYSSIYPFNLDEIYPVSSNAGFQQARPNPLPAYPDFAALYPSKSTVDQIGWNKSQAVSLLAIGYPNLIVYPSVYPYSVYEVYGSTFIEQSSSNTPLEQDHENLQFICSSTKETNVKSRPGYPLIQIYEPVYPHMIIYPSIAIADNDKTDFEPVSTLYPTIQIYKPVYPFFDIYPPVQLEMNWDILFSSTRLKAAYPVLDIYDPVYPHLVIYPKMPSPAALGSQSNYRKRAPTPGPSHRRISLTFPAHSSGDIRVSRSIGKRPLLPPLPATKPIPSTGGRSVKVAEDAQHDVQLHRKPKKTHSDLHVMVFGQQKEQRSPADTARNSPPAYNSRRKPRKTHHELHLMVFGETIGVAGNDLSFRTVIPATPSRQRSRSGTVNQGPTSTFARQTVAIPKLPSPVAESLTNRSSPLSQINSSSSSTPSPIASQVIPPTSSPILDVKFPSSLSNTLRPLPVRGLPSSPSQTRSSVLGLPTSPSHHLLTRVRSMNTRQRSSLENASSTEAHGLDRSKSLSEGSRLSRKSIIQDRARLFAGSDGITNDTTERKFQPSSRPVIHKLDKSKLPFS